MVFGYARVSSKDQNLARQIKELEKYVKLNNIYADKESGKDFERQNYQKLLKKLKKDDLLIIKSIDRLGRNYDLIIEEWRKIVKDIGANIKVLDIPLLDTTQTEGLTGKFIADLVLQILSYVAETERANIKQRQAEGIRLAKERGIKFGRPSAVVNHYAVESYVKGELQTQEAIEKSGCSRGTFFRRVKELRGA